MNSQARETSRHTVYKWLSLYAGYDSGRKKRADAGIRKLSVVGQRCSAREWAWECGLGTGAAHGWQK